MGVRIDREGPEGVVQYTAVGEEGPVPGPRVGVIAWVHGNEPVGGEVLDRLDDAVERELIRGSILAVRANLAARALGLRHTPEGQDMNRLWDPDNLARIAATPPAGRTPEEARVLELLPFLRQTDALLDLHSTSRPAPPFLLHRDDLPHRLIARKLGVRRLVTGVHEGGVLPGGLLVNLDLVPGARGERLGFVFEAGAHDAPGNGDRAWDVTRRLLAALGLWRTCPPVEGHEPDTYEVVERFAQAPRGMAPWRFARTDDTGGTRRALVSFEEIEADEVLVRQGSRVVRADAPFTLLMPAPEAGPGEDLYFVAQRRFGGLGDVAHTRSDAIRSATAVERMLDLIDDDAFARGTTWIGFDGTRILDRCAELVARTLRLPDGHPDRRIAVVGRGDWGGDPVERRRGRRYRAAMRRALELGVPIDRYQLMRGASVGWIDALTSPAMSRRFAGRPAKAPVRMFLSTRQPHTVSVLVCGDLDRAVAEGASRHVRVALVVEALAVVGDGDEVRTRLVRAALFSGRVEILRATHRLIEALRREHQEVVSRAPVAGTDGRCTLLDAGGAFCMDADPESVARLRYALRHLQFATWLASLRPHLAVPRTVPVGRLGAWLAGVMASTGIGDAHTLKRLVARRHGSTWRLDPSGLERALADPLAVPRPPASGRRSPVAEPLLARDVDEHVIERWAGAKRRVLTLQAIPGARGRDVDLLLSRAEIRAGVVDLYAHARRLARNAPGRVLVVVAGDGHSPRRDEVPEAADHLLAHRALVRDPNVRYLRIQHAEATHLAWMKDLLEQIGARGPGAAPIALHWEHAHGGMVNVLLVATALDGPEAASPDALDGWRIEACGVLVSRLEVAAGEYAVGLFTRAFGAPGSRVNPDLIHFARAHCEALLGGRAPRWVDTADALVPPLVDTIGWWIRELRASDPARRVRELGFADPALRDALVRHAAGTVSADEAARRLWDGFGCWPGRGWSRIAAAK